MSDRSSDETRDSRHTSSRVTRAGRARGERRRDRDDDRGTRRAESLLDEVMEVQQGILHAGIELASTGMDTATRVGRNTVDRAFSRDYRDPGDLVRNLGRDAEHTVRDVLDGVRDVPRRMQDGFYDAVRPSKRSTDRGERSRRAAAARDEGGED